MRWVVSDTIKHFCHTIFRHVKQLDSVMCWAISDSHFQISRHSPSINFLVRRNPPIIADFFIFVCKCISICTTSSFALTFFPREKNNPWGQTHQASPLFPRGGPVFVDITNLPHYLGYNRRHLRAMSMLGLFRVSEYAGGAEFHRN